MARLTYTGERRLVRWLTGLDTTPIGSLYVGLVTSGGGETSTSPVEPAASTGYARQPLILKTTQVDTAFGGGVAYRIYCTTQALTWPPLTAAGAAAGGYTATELRFFEGSVGGVGIWWDDILPICPLRNEGDFYGIPADWLTFALVFAQLSDHLSVRHPTYAPSLIADMFSFAMGGSPSAPTFELGLFYGPTYVDSLGQPQRDPTLTDGSGTNTEWTGSNYARVTPSFADAGTATHYWAENSATMNYGPATEPGFPPAGWNNAPPLYTISSFPDWCLTVSGAPTIWLANAFNSTGGPVWPGTGQNLIWDIGSFKFGFSH